MVHLIKNSNGSFDAVTVSKGKLVWHTSPQQYNKRAKALGAIISGMKSFGSVSCRYQDDTVNPSVVKYLSIGRTSYILLDVKPSKPYIPQSKK